MCHKSRGWGNRGRCRLSLGVRCPRWGLPGLHAGSQSPVKFPLLPGAGVKTLLGLKAQPKPQPTLQSKLGIALGTICWLANFSYFLLSEHILLSLEGTMGITAPPQASQGITHTGTHSAHGFCTGVCPGWVRSLLQGCSQASLAGPSATWQRGPRPGCSRGGQGAPKTKSCQGHHGHLTPGAPLCPCHRPKCIAGSSWGPLLLRIHRPCLGHSHSAPDGPQALTPAAGSWWLHSPPNWMSPK